MASMSLPRRSSAHVEAHARRSALVLQRLDARRRRDAGRWYAGVVGASPRSGGRRTAHAGPDATVLDHAPEARGAVDRALHFPGAVAAQFQRVAAAAGTRRDRHVLGIEATRIPHNLERQDQTLQRLHRRTDVIDRRGWPARVSETGRSTRIEED